MEIPPVYTDPIDSGASVVDYIVPASMLTIPEAAEYLRISYRTVENLLRAGHLPTVRVGPGERNRVFIRRVDLDAYLDAVTHPATAGPLAVAALRAAGAEGEQP